MKNMILKQVAGIDVAAKELVVTLGRLHEDLSQELFAHKTFPNNAKGFTAFTAWVKKHCPPIAPLRFVMEATGIYHEALAYFLDGQGYELSIVLPNKISNYIKTLDIKTITDKTASEAICRFGLERKLDHWQKPQKTYKELRQLTRERDQLVGERTVLKNQLHAEQAEAEPNHKSLARLKERLKLLDKQEKQIMAEIKGLISKDKDLQQTVELICSIPGVGLLTAVTVLAETNGFELIRNKKQLASYAGFDVKEKQSGTSVKGKPKISKRGNRYLRKAMYFPAFTAIQHDEHFKALYERLTHSHGIKMKAAVAVQRRLLEMIYVIFSSGKAYDKNYLKQKLKQQDKAVHSPQDLMPIQPQCSEAGA